MSEPLNKLEMSRLDRLIIAAERKREDVSVPYDIARRVYDMADQSSPAAEIRELKQKVKTLEEDLMKAQITLNDARRGARILLEATRCPST